jgi:putative two-component system response regulator
MQSDGLLLAPILIVDDSPENVRLLTRILERGGYTEITATTNPLSVLDRVKEIVPDLVILDLHMPGADGFVVMDEIHAAIEHPPSFLLVTGDAEEKVWPVALRKGADDLLTKPFQVDEVLMRVRLLLEAHRSGGKGRRHLA